MPSNRFNSSDGIIERGDEAVEICSGVDPITGRKAFGTDVTEIGVFSERIGRQTQVPGGSRDFEVELFGNLDDFDTFHGQGSRVDDRNRQATGPD